MVAAPINWRLTAYEVKQITDDVKPKPIVICYEDYAIALVDELEKPAHSRRRFTVGY